MKALELPLGSNQPLAGCVNLSKDPLRLFLFLLWQAGQELLL
jgi:hypothetical protein